MKPFELCPACGGRLAASGDGEGLTCPACGRTWYRSSAPTVGAVIVRDGRALVSVRGRDPHKGKVDVVGGFLRAGEGPLEGLAREVAEETGLEIDVGFGDFVQAVPHTYGPEGDWVLAMGFKARARAGTPQPGSDVAELQWVTLQEVDELDFAWEHDRALVRRVLEEEVAHGRSG